MRRYVRERVGSKYCVGALSLSAKAARLGDRSRAGIRDVLVHLTPLSPRFSSPPFAFTRSLIPLHTISTSHIPYSVHPSLPPSLPPPSLRPSLSSLPPSLPPSLPQATDFETELESGVGGGRGEGNGVKDEQPEKAEGEGDEGKGEGEIERDPSSYSLVEAAQFGVLERCRELVEGEGRDVMAVDDEGITVLHWAAINNRIPVVR